MESWSAPDVPRLPGSGSRTLIWDTASGALAEAAPAPTATIYACGITPYDATHLGHAATFLAWDLLIRSWLDGGKQVTYVQNVTDVDDPLLERAERDQDDWQVLAMRETALFREDMTALRILPPYKYIGAVESIDLVVTLVQRLLAQGAAYHVDEDIYFDVHADPDFGSVSGLDAGLREKIFAERGGDPDRPGKRDPLDCLLWQAERPGEPAWATPLGKGRPGWHIECAAIALEYLGAGIDVQGGGSDLAFPHHEMGAAEAQVVTGERPFAYAYVHAGMVGLDGEKMSKSRGNLVFVSKLRAEGHDPMAIRLALLAHHYRTDWEWHAADLERAETRLARWREAVSRPDAPSADPLLARLRARLADDLDAPGALQAMDDWAESALADPAPNTADPAAPGLAARALDALLGVAL